MSGVCRQWKELVDASVLQVAVGSPETIRTLPFRFHHERPASARRRQHPGAALFIQLTAAAHFAPVVTGCLRRFQKLTALEFQGFHSDPVVPDATGWKTVPHLVFCYCSQVLKVYCSPVLFFFLCPALFVPTCSLVLPLSHRFIVPTSSVLLACPAAEIGFSC
jgi:hypothetical protein